MLFIKVFGGVKSSQQSFLIPTLLEDVNACIYIYIYIFIYLCIYVYIYMYTYFHMFIYMHIVCMYARMYVCICIYVRVWMVIGPSRKDKCRVGVVGYAQDFGTSEPQPYTPHRI